MLLSSSQQTMHLVCNPHILQQENTSMGLGYKSPGSYAVFPQTGVGPDCLNQIQL